MRPGPRDRITIELRGLRERLYAQASARGVTVATLARSTLMASLDGEPGGSDRLPHEHVTGARGEAHLKVTLRLPAAHALLLAKRARAADVAQGTYVAGLIDGVPLAPLPANHANAVAALVGSTDQLATLGTDLNAFMRLVGRVPSPELERYGAGLQALADEVRGHLAVAAPLVAALKTARSPR
jgi:hypothetical protein